MKFENNELKNKLLLCEDKQSGETIEKIKRRMAEEYEGVVD